MAKKKKKKAPPGKLAKKTKGRDNDLKLLEMEGQKFFNAGNYAGAITTWNRLLRLRGGINSEANKKFLPLLAQANFAQAKLVAPPERLSYLLSASLYVPDDPEIILEFLQHCREVGKTSEYLAFCEQMISENKNKNLFSKIKYLLDMEKGKEEENPPPLSEVETKHLKLLGQICERSFSKALRTVRTLGQADYYLFLTALLEFEEGHGEIAKELLEKLVNETSDPILRTFSKYYLAVYLVQHDHIIAAEEHLLGCLNEIKRHSSFTKGARRQRIANLLSHLALRRARENEVEKAANLWKHALEWKPGHPGVSLNLERAASLLATNYAKDGQVEKALEFWDPLFKHQNDNPLISKNLAIAYQRLGKFPEAIRYWEHTANLWEQNLNRTEDVLRMKCDLVRTYEQMAKCYDKQGQSWYVRKSYQRILELDPQNLKIKAELAEHYLEERMIEEALNLLDELIEEEPQNPAHLTNMGIACEVSQRDKEAVGWWEKALKVDPNEGTARELLSKQYHKLTATAYQKSDYREALEILGKWLNLKPKDYHALCLKGAIYTRQRNHEEAQACFDQVVANDPQNPQIYLQVGGTLLELGNEKDAGHYFDEAQKYPTEYYPLDEILRKIGILYCQQDLTVVPSSPYLPSMQGEEEPCVDCQDQYYCHKGANYFHRAIVEGGYYVALSIAKFLLEIDCKNLIIFAEVAHNLNPRDPEPLLYLAMYHMKHQNFQEFHRVFARARNTPDYETNPEMQQLLARMSHFADIFERELF